MQKQLSGGVLVGKRVLKLCCKVTGEHQCRSAISINLQSNFIEITLRHGCSPVNLLHIFRALSMVNPTYPRQSSCNESYLTILPWMKTSLNFFIFLTQDFHAGNIQKLIYESLEIILDVFLKRIEKVCKTRSC